MTFNIIVHCTSKYLWWCSQFSRQKFGIFQFSQEVAFPNYLAITQVT